MKYLNYFTIDEDYKGLEVDFYKSLIDDLVINEVNSYLKEDLEYIDYLSQYWSEVE